MKTFQLSKDRQFNYSFDANGDGATDGLDINIIDNNNILGIFYARPY